jgi:hypothetical protein
LRNGQNEQFHLELLVLYSFSLYPFLSNASSINSFKAFVALPNLTFPDEGVNVCILGIVYSG